MRTSWIFAAAAACALALSAPAIVAAAVDPSDNGGYEVVETYGNIDDTAIIGGTDFGALDDTMLTLRHDDLGLADPGPILVVNAFDDGAYRALDDLASLQSPDIGDRLSMTYDRGLIDTDAIASAVGHQTMRTTQTAADGPERSGALDDLANPAAGRFNSA